MKIISQILVVLLIILFGVFSPLAVIWALNTLFNLGIGYTFINWLAVIILSGVFQPMLKFNSSK